MSVNQTVRSVSTTNNPSGFLSDILNLGQILVNTTPPISTTGNAGDYFIDSTSGDLYGKKSVSGVWGPPIYNFVTGGGSGELTNLLNIGEGVQIFKPPLNGTVAELRTLTSNGNEINIDTDIPIVGSLNLGMSVAYKPVLLSGIRDNGVLAVSVGGDTVDPNGLLGLPEYPRGSLYIQIGTTDTLWICNDAVSKVWVKLSGVGAGISSITNVGAGVGVFRDLTAPSAAGENANFKSITGTFGKTDVVDEGSFIRTDMSPDYVPVALNKLYNIQDNRTGDVSGPTNNDDSASGYSRGSMWVEQEISGLNKIWFCNNPANGAAEWHEFLPSGGSTNKDFVQFTIGATVGYTQTITGVFQDFNFGPDAPSNPAIALSSLWSSLFDGTRQVFRRALTNATKSYLCNISVTIQSFSPTGDENDYVFFMVRKFGGLIYPQSTSTVAFPASTVSNKQRTMTSSFIFTESSPAVEDYYFRVKGTQAGGGTAVNFNVNTWAVSFKQI